MTDPEPKDSVPAIDNAFVERLFKELESYDVLLDEDPLEFGPKRLNAKTAQVRDYLSEVERMYLRLTHYMQLFKAQHRAADTLYKNDRRNLLASDPEIRSARNAAMQEAIIDVRLKDTLDLRDEYAGVIDTLVSLIAAVKSKKGDLKDIQQRLRDQLNLCKEELGLGNRWGSKTPPPDPAPRTDTIFISDLRELDEVPDELNDDLPTPAAQTTRDAVDQALEDVMEGRYEAAYPPNDDLFDFGDL